MTEVDFLALEPWERDALVAEKVMGWERVTDSEEINKREGMKAEDTGGLHREMVWFAGDIRKACFECGDMPDYTTSIADAWLVVEKMQEEGFIGGIYLPDPKANRDHCYATFGSLSPCEGFSATADTAPLAICLAALRAKGIVK